MIRFQMITKAEVLSQLCEQWLNDEKPLALDTEFMRTDTYFPLLALVQLNDGKNTYLIDPLVDGLAELLKAVLESSFIPKVVHACSEDLQVLSQCLNAKVNNVFDTQIAAAYCGHGFAISYQKLVAALCDVQLAKDATRSDWMQRPLSDKQLDYAALDVEYLLPMYALMSDKLESLDRLSWVHEDCKKLEIQGQAVIDPAQSYLRFKRAWQLSRRQLLVLQQLSEWRERTAIDRNKPRSWIVKDSALLQIAQLGSADVNAMQRVDDLQPSQFKRNHKAWLDIIDSSLKISQEQYPQALAEPPGRGFSAITKRFKACINKTAEQIDVAPEMLARKKDLELLLQSMQRNKPELPESLQGWRAAVIGKQLMAIAEQKNG